MSEHHKLQELQHDIGQAGRFGEVFIGLGILIFTLGAVLWGLGNAGYFDTGAVGEAGSRDNLLVGFLFIVEGIGFVVFGAFSILSGWDRHHDHED